MIPRHPSVPNRISVIEGTPKKGNAAAMRRILREAPEPVKKKASPRRDAKE
jgi:hypothetical protein